MSKAQHRYKAASGLTSKVIMNEVKNESISFVKILFRHCKINCIRTQYHTKKFLYLYIYILCKNNLQKKFSNNGNRKAY